MFERFTQEARSTVLAAVTVAQETGAAKVDTRHLLHALAADPGPAGRALAGTGVTPERVHGSLAGSGGVDAEALRAVGIDYDEIRRAVDAQFGAGALDRVVRRGRRQWPGHLPFASEAKQVLTQALREATVRRDRRIGADHLLLGLLALPDSTGHALLTGYDVDLLALRATLDPPTRRAG